MGTAAVAMSAKHSSKLGARVPLTALIAVGALLIAGCGGSSSPGVAHLPGAKGSASASPESVSSSPGSKASLEQKMVAYAKCMRSNGVPNFPEPAEGHFVPLSRALGRPGSGDKLRESAPFKAADRRCRKLLPNGGVPSPQAQRQMEELALKVARCMRAHGVPNYPTPNVEGQRFVRVGIHPGSGLDTSTPQFGAAQRACARSFGLPVPKGGAPVAAAPGGGAGGVAVAP